MAQAQSNVFDRFNDALRNLDDQLQDLRDRFDDQVKKFESEAGKQIEKIETQVKESSLYKRSEQVARDIEKQFDRGLSQVYDVIGIASKSEIERINRKLNSISKKLNELAKEQQPAKPQQPAPRAQAGL